MWPVHISVYKAFIRLSPAKKREYVTLHRIYKPAEGFVVSSRQNEVFPEADTY